MKTAVVVVLTAFLIVALYQGAGLALRAWRNRMNLRAVIAAVMTAAYAVSPIDIVPDVLIGVGWIDDLIVLVMAYLYIRRVLQQSARPAKPVAETHRPATPRPSRASQETIEIIPER